MEHLELPEGVRVWFGSDHHLNHKRIIEFCNRPFQNLGHMNVEIVRRHNALVQADDIYFAVGDLAMGDFEEAMGFAASLNGIKYIVLGNHDRASTVFDRGRNIERYTRRYEQAGFTVLPETGVTIDLHGTRIAVCHYPYFGDHTERDRHVALRPKDEGLPLVHGHIHAERRISGRMFNVGVDVNDFTPVSQEEILAFARGLR